METTNSTVNPIKKDFFNFHHRWKLKSWINASKLHWTYLHNNPNALYLLEQYPDKIDYQILSRNPSAIHLLVKNIDKLNKWGLSSNQSAIHILQKNPDLIHWGSLSSNPAAIHIIDNHIDNKLSITNLDIINKISWRGLSENPSAIHLLEQNPDKIDWVVLSKNPAAIHLLEQNPDKIDWFHLSENTAAIHLLEQNKNKINWLNLCKKNTAAIHLLEDKLKNIFNEPDFSPNFLATMLYNLAENPAALHILQNEPVFCAWYNLSYNPNIFEIDFDFFVKRMDILRIELMEKTWHPDRLRNWCLACDDI